MADLNDLSVSFSRFLSDLEPMQHAMGQAGKKAAHEQIEDDLGGDRSFSGMKRKVRLGAGYDIGEPVVLNMRPKGLVVLADKGRRRTKKITPRRRGGFVALGTPFGVKASAMSTPSRGHNTIDKTVTRLETDVPRAVEREVARAIERF